MNSDSSEVDTSSTNGRSIRMPSPPAGQQQQQHKQKQQQTQPSMSSSSSGAALASHGRLAAIAGATAAAAAATSYNTNTQQQTTTTTLHTPAGSGRTHGSSTFHAGEFNEPPGAAAAANTNATLAMTQRYDRPHERYVWEMRTRSPNVTPASTVLNSPDLNGDAPAYGGLLGLHFPPQQQPLQESRHHQQQQQHHSRTAHHHPYHHPHHQIRVGRSPGSQFEPEQMLPQGLTSPGSPTDVGKAGGQCLRDGEIVVFDDIDTGWASNNKLANNHGASGGAGKGAAAYGAEDVLKVTKMIGQLPIAEYEGSPRRFGNPPTKQQGPPPSGAALAATTANMLPKRPPGFPQRISSLSSASVAAATSSGQGQTAAHQYYPSAAAPEQQDNNQSFDNLIDMETAVEGGGGGTAGFDASANGGDSKSRTPTFDYLYEFSETRKVLEEFFKANPEDEKRFTDYTESGDDVASCDTHQEFEERDREREEEKHIEQAYIGQRLARTPKEELYMVHRSPRKQVCENIYNHSGEHNDIELYIDSNSRSSRSDLADTEMEANLRRHSRNFTLSPETTDYDSNCGDLDSLSNDINGTTDYGKLYTSMPVLEDGLSSGHASDTENNVNNGCVGDGGDGAVVVVGVDGDEDTEPCVEQTSVALDSNYSATQQQQQQQQMMIEQNEYNARLTPDCRLNSDSAASATLSPRATYDAGSSLITDLLDIEEGDPETAVAGSQRDEHHHHLQRDNQHEFVVNDGSRFMINNNNNNNLLEHSPTNEEAVSYEAIYAAATPCGGMSLKRTPSPQSACVLSAGTAATMAAPEEAAMTTTAAGRSVQPQQKRDSDIQEAMKEIRSALQRAKTQPEKLKFCDEVLPPDPESPVWVPRKNGPGVAAAVVANNNHQHQHRLPHTGCGEEDELDTDLETDRLLGQQRLDDQGYYDDKTIWPKTTRIDDSNDDSPAASDVTLLTNHSNNSIKSPQAYVSATLRQGVGTAITPTTPDHCQIVGDADVGLTSPEKLQYAKSPTGSIKSLKDSVNSDKKAKASRNKEGLLPPAVLIEGVLFRARYLGSTQLVCEGQPTKSTRMMQAEEAVSRIKAPEGESQPSTEVDLFISTEKIMVLNTDLKEIMMDHALRTISYIADIGDLVVLMARRRFVPSESCNNSDGDTNDTSNGGGAPKETKENGSSGTGAGTTPGSVATLAGSLGLGKHNRTPKMICHVFESDEAQFIAQSIGQAFQVAYMEFLKANGIEDHSFVKEMDYQEVLNSQEIFGDELEIFAKKELQKEVVVPKAKGEILGVVIVESGWGSMLPTVVIANLMSTGAAARCGQLNIGDQLIAINGMSLVGLPLSTCQSYIRNAKNQTAVKFTVVPCPPVVEVKIKRPNTKYQLGFSVQNGVICSLLRGGIAERGGVRVGHRIIEINNQSVVAVPHEKIVNLLATSVGEILMKTMPTSMFRLLTGQENPIYI